jgi:hypothetical protein
MRKVNYYVIGDTVSYQGLVTTIIGGYGGDMHIILKENGWDLVKEHVKIYLMDPIYVGKKGYGVRSSELMLIKKAELIPEVEPKLATNKFKVGDVVIGNSSERYLQTTKGWIGKVIRVLEDKVDEDDIIVQTGPGATTFSVGAQYFDLYDDKYRLNLLKTPSSDETTPCVIIGHTVVRPTVIKRIKRKGTELLPTIEVKKRKII